MKYDQQRRYNKIYTDEFYLLDHKSTNINTEFYEFAISGSTRSVYKVKLYTSGKTFCTCPDFLGHAKRAGCVCKHVCFVMARVLKYNDETFYDTLTFDYEQIRDICLCLEIDTSLINLSLKDQYIDAERNKPDFTKYRTLLEEAECPICYTEFDDKEKLLGCPACKNAVHVKCMEKWLTIKKTCAYCRNDVWKHYGSEKNQL